MLPSVDKYEYQRINRDGNGRVPRFEDMAKEGS